MNNYSPSNSLASNLFKLNVFKPEANKVDYEQTLEGWWAFLTEVPTTRAFGNEKQDAFRNLIILQHRSNE
jgi:hypothetical protein